MFPVDEMEQGAKWSLTSCSRQVISGANGAPSLRLLHPPAGVRLQPPTGSLGVYLYINIRILPRAESAKPLTNHCIQVHRPAIPQGLALKPSGGSPPPRPTASQPAMLLLIIVATHASCAPVIPRIKPCKLPGYNQTSNMKASPKGGVVV